MNNKRVLIIGLDGFSWRIGDRLLQEGYMPTLSELVRKGCRGNLQSVMPFETAPAWSSFQTGCSPEKTGVYAFHSYHPKEKKITLNNFHNISVPTIWEIASREGKKTVSINMPMTSPPPHINGIIVPGLTCPGITRNVIHPPEIYDHYIKQFANYQIVNKDLQNSLRGYVDKAIQTEMDHLHLSRRIMQEFDWDIFCLQVQSTDFYQHRNWWSLDTCAEGYSGNDFLISSAFYRYLDTMIGELINVAGEDALVFIASDHGFVGKKADISINSWLSQKGYLQLRPTVSRNFIKDAKSKVPFIKHCARSYGKMKKFVSSKLKTNSKDSGLFAEQQMRHIREIIDFDNTTAFCLGGLAGLMYLQNCKKNTASHIINGLLTTYGPDSDEPLISDIQPAENVYSSSHRHDNCPDYVVMLSEGVEHRIDPRGDVVKKNYGEFGQTGTHDPNGIFVISGPEVRKNHSFDCRIIDVAPTILSYLNIPVPDYMDGSVLQEAFENPLNINYNSGCVETEYHSNESYSDKEQAEVEKQLRDLGYL